jgi:hypothetical protein
MAELRVRVMLPLRAGDGGTAGRRAGSPRQPPHCHGGDVRGRCRGGGRGDLRHVSQTFILLRRRARHSPVTASGGDIHGASIRWRFGAGSALRRRARPGRPRWKRRRSRLGKHTQSRLVALTQPTRLLLRHNWPRSTHSPPPPLRFSCLSLRCASPVLAADTLSGGGGGGCRSRRWRSSASGLSARRRRSARRSARSCWPGRRRRGGSARR